MKASLLTSATLTVGIVLLSLGCITHRTNSNSGDLANQKTISTTSERESNTGDVNSHSLYMAASRGEENEVRNLLMEQVDPDSRYESETPLMAAASNCQDNVLNLLLEQGANTALRDSFGFTAFLQAARSGCVEAMRILLNHRSDIDSLNYAGQSAPNLALDAHHGVQNGAVVFLLENGASVSAEDLLLSPRTGSLSIVKTIYERGDFGKISLLEREMGYSIFLELPEGGHTDIIDYLLEKGADLESKDMDGRTILMLSTNSPFNLEYYLSAGANVNAKDKKGRTVLFYLFKPEYTEILNFEESLGILLQFNVCLTCTDMNGMTAVEYAKQLCETDRVNRYNRILDGTSQN